MWREGRPWREAVRARAWVCIATGSPRREEGFWDRAEDEEPDPLGGLMGFERPVFELGEAPPWFEGGTQLFESCRVVLNKTRAELDFERRRYRLLGGVLQSGLSVPA